MKLVKSILFFCVIAHFQVNAMDNNRKSYIIQELANRCYEAGMHDANEATMSRVLEIVADSRRIKIQANNNIITQKFYTLTLQDQLTAAKNDCRNLNTRLRINENIRDAFRTRIQRQDTEIETLTNQRNTALNRIQQMQQAQLYALGSAAMITLIDPIEKQYLIDTTSLSAEEIDSKMIGERLFIFSALALCHPIPAAIVATSAAAIKAQQYFQTSTSH